MLVEHMVWAGYENIQIMDATQFPHPLYNFRVEAYKPNSVYSGIYEYKEVVEKNVYKVLPEELKDRTVIDVGAHIGSFAYLASKYGAKRIICIEPNIENFTSLVARNIHKAEYINKAVYDGSCNALIMSNEGGRSKRINSQGEGGVVETITLKDVIKDVVDNKRLVLKMDCEGAEYPILMNITAPTMKRFGVIYIEIHGELNTEERYRGISNLVDRIKYFGFKEIENI